ncbi:Bifunctional ATP-dependent dihydroxyacetone kinase/FAD-AMP lyase (cyclizing) [Tetrabaena socialis]|uniref:Bifunctional ATP-dependent dihydroxyacetone kinase/FAD-AMP lyase (Cyclizing) n=1 Tax=Tetrabaena socialis TaxID=47790 RepID=A0A2J8AHS2_9CHLO|nr:Bifunctional ATP-dependent dihydroxyacetone kinase/FAD-AMP lyase (cyclizing) [Tetrabaena socialis]|eukprot:PNH12074.1 Bifunctional ATP-dependent dihydroxyacetone kinase/FAD-AMP lyase (cyclizing) [Tetrabaena socialis]
MACSSSVEVLRPKGLEQAAPVYETSPKDWADALAAGLAAVQKYGRADLGCRTMLDALLPARDALVASLAEGADACTAAAAAASAAEAGAAATLGMAATAGRASYVPAEVLRSVADPGAQAAAMWLRAVATAVRG